MEEAWFQALALGQYLTLKGGRCRSGMGYQNEQHPHARDFATDNLMYEARRASTTRLRQSGNAAIQPGKPGYFEAARQVAMLEKPVVLDRSQGDVHAAGNPHIQTDPRNIARVAQTLSVRLIEIDPDHATSYQTRLADFNTRCDDAMANPGGTAQGNEYRGPAPVLPLPGELAGIETGCRTGTQARDRTDTQPSCRSRGTTQGCAPARAVLRAAYQSARPAEWLAGHAGLSVVVLPFTVGGAGRAQDLFGLFDDGLA